MSKFDGTQLPAFVELTNQLSEDYLHRKSEVGPIAKIMTMHGELMHALTRNTQGGVGAEVDVAAFAALGYLSAIYGGYPATLPTHGVAMRLKEAAASLLTAAAIILERERPATADACKRVGLGEDDWAGCKGQPEKEPQTIGDIVDRMQGAAARQQQPNVTMSLNEYLEGQRCINEQAVDPAAIFDPKAMSVVQRERERQEYLQRCSHAFDLAHAGAPLVGPDGGHSHGM